MTLTCFKAYEMFLLRDSNDESLLKLNVEALADKELMKKRMAEITKLIECPDR